MVNFVEGRTSIIKAIFDEIDEYLNTGDPEVREWFLVKSNFWPIFLCSMYVLVAKVIGPAVMRYREPFELRNSMIVYNFSVVATYTVCLIFAVYGMSKTGNEHICKNTAISKENYTYMLVSTGWVVYLLKYAEFFDTVFFVLRKKDKLITHLHVIHHATLPILGWVFFRTERSGFQVYPIMLNSVVHIVMYSYYALAAMGPNVRKYLWWKRYLTIAQMIQFILIILSVTVVMPLAGCTVAKWSVYINITGASVFFALFYNFYRNSFKPSKPQEKGSIKEENGTRKKVGSDDAHHNDFGSKDTTINSQTKIKSN